MKTNPESDLAASAEALRKAAESLQQAMAPKSAGPAPTSAAQSPAKQGVPAQDVPAQGVPAQGVPAQDITAQRFYEQLEQAGQIVDVDENTDLASLPPRITHIRHPDGSIERLGFS
jgi:hypothetical protein